MMFFQCNNFSLENAARYNELNEFISGRDNCGIYAG